MDAIFRALLCAALTQITGSQLSINIHPNTSDVEEPTEVTILCSLNLLHPKIDRVYSIMLKRRETTVAVLLNDGVEMPDRQYTVDGTLSATPTGTASLKLTLKNVTCSDRGDYSCMMAVRKSYRNLKLGPVSSPFIVIGKPSSIVYKIEPRKEAYEHGEDIMIRCSILTKYRDSDWSWTLSHSSVSESCSYIESDCLYSCTSSVSHDVTKDDIWSERTCGINGKVAVIKFSVTDFPIQDITGSQPGPELTNIETTNRVKETTTTQIPAGPLSNETKTGVAHVYYSGERGSDKRTILIYCFVAVFCFLFLCVFIFIFLSDRFGCQRLCRRRNSEYYNHRHHYNERQTVVLIPVSEPRCANNTSDHRYRHSESEYLISHHTTDDRPTTDRTLLHNNEHHNNALKNGCTTASENIYDEVDNSNVQQSSSVSFETEIRSCSTSACRQYMADVDHCNNDEPVQSDIESSLNV